MKYHVILFNLLDDSEFITISKHTTKTSAEESRRILRNALGNHWVVDRRPGIDTFDNLGIMVTGLSDEK